MNFQFSEIEFRSMMFNPVKVPPGSTVVRHYKDLGKNKVLRRKPVGLDNNKVMLYVMCMYDRGSPYREKFPDVLKRKIEIAHDVGFVTIEGGVFEEPVEDMLKGFNTQVNNKVVEYVRMHRNFKYTYLVGIENSYYTIMREVMNGNTKRVSDLRNIQEELESTLMEMLSEDDNPHVRDAVLRYIEEDRLLLRPEDIAVKMRESEDEPVTAHKEV